MSAPSGTGASVGARDEGPAAHDARGSIDGLGSSSPLGLMLPAVFADDDFAQRFVAGLDEVLAPIHNVLDCLDSYFAPSLAPADFTRWLGDWVGAETDGVLDTAALRAAVAAAAQLHRIRGTRRGLAEAVRLAFGVEPEITESGGATWDARPLGPVPGARRPHLSVTVRLTDPAAADLHRLELLVAAARPAHMPYTVQVTAVERTKDR
jgi:phage tail-like protein